MSRDLSVEPQRLAIVRGKTLRPERWLKLAGRQFLIAANRFLDLVWAYRMTLSFVFCVALFVLLIASVSRTQQAQQEASLLEAETARIESIQTFIAQMLGAAPVDTLDASARFELTQRIDEHTPKIAARFPDDAEAQLRLLGIAANVHLALKNRDRYDALLLRQASLLADRPQLVRPQFIATLVHEADYARSKAALDDASQLLAQADTLLQRSGLEGPELRARWWLANATIAAEQGKDSVAFHGWQQAEALFAKLGQSSRQRFDTLARLGQSAATWNPEYAERVLIQASRLAVSLSPPPVAILSREIYPTLAKLQQGRGEPASAINSLQQGAAMASGLEDRELILRYALKLHALGQPQDWQALAPLAAAAPMAGPVLEMVDAMLVSGRPAQAKALLDQLAELPDHRLDAAQRVHAQLLVIRLAQAQSKTWAATRPAAELARSLEDGQVPMPWVPRVQLTLADLSQARGQLGRSAELFRAVLHSANGQLSTEALRARIGLAEIARRQGAVRRMLRHTTVAVLAYDGFDLPHDHRLGPAVWQHHAQALELSGDSSSARLWLERARGRLQAMQSEPAAVEWLAEIDRHLSRLEPVSSASVATPS